MQIEMISVAEGADTNLKQLRSMTESTTFAGIRGSVGDTGLTYLFQARSKKTKGINDLYAAQNDGTDDSTSKVPGNKHTPWDDGSVQESWWWCDRDV